MMSHDLRKLRFNSKVKIEREILSVINSSILASEFELAGMSKEAIITWQSKLSSDLSSKAREVIFDRMLEISRNAQIISDNSCAVFNEGTYFNNSKYQVDKSELNKLLQELQ